MCASIVVESHAYITALHVLCANLSANAKHYELFSCCCLAQDFSDCKFVLGFGWVGNWWIQTSNQMSGSCREGKA